MQFHGLDAYGAIPVNELGTYEFVARYVSLQPGKCVTPAEVRGYRAAKKSVVLVYEDQAYDGLGGASMGAEKARNALPVLHSIGWPTGRPVYFAYDFSSGTYESDYLSMLSCAVAFANGIGSPPAVYCDAWLAEYMAAHGVHYIWQFGEDMNGVEGPGPHALIWQAPSTTAPWGQGIDPDTAYVADYGQWAPDVPQKEDPMEWIDTSPDGKEVILVSPGLGGYYVLGQEAIAYYEANGVPKAKKRVITGVFTRLKKLGVI